VQQTALRLMKEKGIIVQFNADAVSVSYETGKQYILCADGAKIDFFEAIWCTQAAAPAWLQGCAGLDLVDGFIAVRSTLQSTSAPDVFSVGDVNHMVDSPRPKAGVFAVRAGYVLCWLCCAIVLLLVCWCVGAVLCCCYCCLLLCCCYCAVVLSSAVLDPPPSHRLTYIVYVYHMSSPPLLRNMKNKLYGLELESWAPQDQFLSIIGIAPDYALASR
jgi:hypothetical protein